MTTENLTEILQNPAFQKVSDDTAEQINHENTVVAIITAADL